MRLTATTNEFTRIFELTNMKELFNPVILDVKKTIINMVGRDPADTVLTSMKFKGIKIEDNTDEKICFDPEEMINALKIFKSDEEISITVVGNTIVIANSEESEINDVLTLPLIDISTLDAQEFPFKILNGLPVITNKATGKQIEFTINATIPVKYLAELVKRANFTGINPKIYKVIFDGNTLKGVVGSSSDFQKSVTTTVNITGEGSGELLFGAGLEEMVSTLSGDITINAMPNAPAWFTMKTDKNIVHVLIAPALKMDE